MKGTPLFLDKMGKMVHKKGIKLPDRQLACAPVYSPMGRAYYDAMSCAANFAWANRQILMHNAFETLMRILSKSPGDMRAHLVYDICHNIAKIEDHSVNG